MHLEMVSTISRKRAVNAFEMIFMEKFSIRVENVQKSFMNAEQIDLILFEFNLSKKLYKIWSLL